MREAENASHSQQVPVISSEFVPTPPHHPSDPAFNLRPTNAVPNNTAVSGPLQDAPVPAPRGQIRASPIDSGNQQVTHNGIIRQESQPASLPSTTSMGYRLGPPASKAPGSGRPVR